MRISVSGLEVSQVKAVLSQRATARAAPEDIAGPKSEWEQEKLIIEYINNKVSLARKR